MEEAQHARLDTLMVEGLAEVCSPAEIERGFADYAAIGALLDGGLRQQVEFDLQSFERATGRLLTSTEIELFRSVQTGAIRWTYLGSGMTHPNFLETVGDISPTAVMQISQMAPAFS
jgi:hypothetical protein